MHFAVVIPGSLGTRIESSARSDLAFAPQLRARLGADGVTAGLTNRRGEHLHWQRILPTQVVAERVGYGSVSSFNTAFSRAMGIAPGHRAPGTGQFGRAS